MNFPTTTPDVTLLRLTAGFVRAFLVSSVISSLFLLKLKCLGWKLPILDLTVLDIPQALLLFRKSTYDHQCSVALVVLFRLVDILLFWRCSNTVSEQNLRTVGINWKHLPDSAKIPLDSRDCLLSLSLGSGPDGVCVAISYHYTSALSDNLDINSKSFMIFQLWYRLGSYSVCSSMAVFSSQFPSARTKLRATVDPSFNSKPRKLDPDDQCFWVPK